jgi:hypothetical protein
MLLLNILRAATDGAGAAIGTPAIWASLETQTAATGETHGNH